MVNLQGVRTEGGLADAVSVAGVTVPLTVSWRANES